MQCALRSSCHPHSYSRLRSSSFSLRSHAQALTAMSYGSGFASAPENVGQVGAPLLLARLLQFLVDGLGLVRRLHGRALVVAGLTSRCYHGLPPMQAGGASEGGAAAGPFQPASGGCAALYRAEHQNCFVPAHPSARPCRARYIITKARAAMPASAPTMNLPSRAPRSEARAPPSWLSSRRSDASSASSASSQPEANPV